MIKSLSLLLFFAALSLPNWQPDFEKAQQIAREKNQHILLNFSGSDWCGPCIRMRKDIFENEQFTKMSDTTLVLVNADFPRQKKNQLDKTIRKQNEVLADKYNPEGNFPFTVLLEANGKVIKSWVGFPAGDVQKFIAEIRNSCDGSK